MKLREACLTIGGAVALVLVSALSVQAQAGSLASGEQVEKIAVVRDVQMRDSAVQGVIVNQSSRLLRDVKVVIHHNWLWKNERHPGDENPGRSEYYTVPGEVAAGGSLPFTYHLDPPLPQRADGHFVTSAEVISFTEVGQ